MATSMGMSIDEYLENLKIKTEYKQQCITNFMEHGMTKAELQTARKMYINGFG